MLGRFPVLNLLGQEREDESTLIRRLCEMLIRYEKTGDVAVLQEFIAEVKAYAPDDKEAQEALVRRVLAACSVSEDVKASVRDSFGMAVDSGARKAPPAGPAPPRPAAPPPSYAPPGMFPGIPGIPMDGPPIGGSPPTSGSPPVGGGGEPGGGGSYGGGGSPAPYWGPQGNMSYPEANVAASSWQNPMQWGAGTMSGRYRVVNL